MIIIDSPSTLFLLNCKHLKNKNESYYKELNLLTQSSKWSSEGINQSLNHTWLMRLLTAHLDFSLGHTLRFFRSPGVDWDVGFFWSYVFFFYLIMWFGSLFWRVCSGYEKTGQTLMRAETDKSGVVAEKSYSWGSIPRFRETHTGWRFKKKKNKVKKEGRGGWRGSFRHTHTHTGVFIHQPWTLELYPN